MLFLLPYGDDPFCRCLYAVFVLGILTFFMCKSTKMLWYHNNRLSTPNIPPGSHGLPFIGETIQFMAAINSGRGFYDFVRIRRLRYGNCFKTKIFGETQVFVSSTESAKTILNNESGKFTKKYIKSIAELVGDHSLLCASYQHHKLIRSRLINLFSTRSISRFIRQFDQLIVTSLGTWEDEATVILLHQALQITLKAMCKMLISVEDGEELETLQEDIGRVYEAMLAFPLRLPWSRFSRGLKARERIMKTLEMMMNERRRSREVDRQDFLQCLLAESDEEKTHSDETTFKLSDSEIKDNILTMIIAGQDTTASAITWMVKYLGENQNVLETLRVEQHQLAEKTSAKPFLTLEDLNEMPYASKVVKESLRMASIVPWFPRLSLHDCEIEGYKIMEGWNVNVDAKSIHLDPNVFRDPNKFNPSRFDEESRACRFLAFGMGGRTCLGINMAKAMMLVFLHRLVTTFQWSVMDSDSSTEKWALFSRLKSGCPVRVTRIYRQQ